MQVWGRPESAALERPYKPSEAITPEHWRDYGFDVLRCLHGADERPCRSIPDDDRHHPISMGYAELRVSRDQVRRVWPIPTALVPRLPLVNAPLRCWALFPLQRR
jgi:hypothetical protein